MNYQNPPQDYKKIERLMTDATTPEEVTSARIEAFHKKYYDLVAQGRQILKSTFGYTNTSEATLTPPTA